MFIKSENIYLRALDTEDLDLLYATENNANIWKVSNTLTPFSKKVLSDYLQIANEDIYTTKQLRLMICLVENNEAIGTIDLFDFDPLNERVGLGILIFELYRNKGFALQAIALVKKYVFDMLLLNQIYCNISVSNTASISLFKKNGFNQIGIKKQWNKISQSVFEDEIMFQCLLGN